MAVCLLIKRARHCTRPQRSSLTENAASATRTLAQSAARQRSTPATRRRKPQALRPRSHAMPLKQLMRKLSRPEGAKRSSEASRAEHDCAGPWRPMVTAEVIQLNGRAPSCAGSLGSMDSATEQATVSARPASTSGAVACPRTARAMRARGKAALRCQSLQDGAHPMLLSVPSGSPPSHSQQLPQLPACCSPGSAASSGGEILPAYHRSATAPLPGTRHSLALLRRSSECGADESDDGQELLSPMAADDEEELAAAAAPAHCDWEDGVVAGWLQGIDEADLLVHDTDDAAGWDQQRQAQAQAQQQKPAPAGPAAPAIYSSLLYQ